MNESKQKVSKADELQALGFSVMRPVVRTAGDVPTNPLPYVARSVADRILIMADKVITIERVSPSGKRLPPKIITTRQVAVMPSNANSKAKATKQIGAVECRESGETFWLWSHVGMVNGQFAPVVYDLAPEILAATFQRAQDERAAMPDELKAAMGFVG